MRFLLVLVALICALVAYKQEPPALEALIQCAEQDSASAQYNLGMMYARGDGVAQHDSEAIRRSG